MSWHRAGSPRAVPGWGGALGVHPVGFGITTAPLGPQDPPGSARGRFSQRKPVPRIPPRRGWKEGIAQQKALSCLALGWEVIQRSLGSESCFSPNIPLNSRCYFPAQSFPTIRSLSNDFHLLFP